MKLMKQIVNIGYIHAIHLILIVIKYGIVEMGMMNLTVDLNLNFIILIYEKDFIVKPTNIIVLN